MRYYAEYRDGRLTGIGEGGTSGKTITKEEYDSLYADIVERARLFRGVYNDSFSLADVPEKWREEIRLAVEERKRREEEAANTEENNLKSFREGYQEGVNQA